MPSNLTEQSQFYFPPSTIGFGNLPSASNHSKPLSLNFFDTPMNGTGVDNVQRILAQATEHDLLNSRNPAYMALCNRVTKMEVQIETQQGFINTLLQTRSANVTSSTAQQRTEPIDSLIIPPSPALCHSEDHEDVKFWTKLSWKKYTKDCDDRSRNYQKFDCITDEDGNPVDPERIIAMSQKARQIFNTLYRYRHDPKSWSVRTDEAASFFSNTMRANFHEFKWCENDWKVQFFATEKYPDWVKDVRKLNRLTRANPSIQTTSNSSKRRSENNDGSLKKKKKKKQHNSTPQSDVDPDDIYEPHSSSSLPPERSSAPRPISPVSELTTTSLIPATHVPASGHLPSVSHSVLQPMTVSQQVAILPSTSVPQAILHNSAFITTSTTPVVATDLVSSVSSVSQLASALPSVSQSVSDLPSIAPSESISQVPPAVLASRPGIPARPATTIDSPLSHPQPAQNTPDQTNQNIAVASVMVNASAPTIMRHDSDMFNDIQIPESVSVVPHTVNVPSGSGTRNPATRKGKPMVLGKGLTPRNLFAADYLKDHPETTPAEFKKVYDQLDNETKKRYDELCKHRKTEAAQAKKADATATR